MGLDDTAARLRAELDAWRRLDALRQREGMDADAEEILGADGGIRGPTQRVRALLPLVVGRAREDRAPEEPVARGVDGARQVLTALREWLTTHIENLPPIGKSDPETRCEQGLAALRDAIKGLRRGGARARRDLDRVLLDVDTLAGWLGDFAENARRRAGFPPLPDEEPWPEEKWRRFLWESALREHTVLADIERDGFSEEALERSWKAERSRGDEEDRRHRNFEKRFETQRRCAFSWDPDQPERYLDLEELPDPPEEEEPARRSIDEPDEEPWRESLEIEQPPVEEPEDDFDRYEDDPFFQALEEFTLRFFRASRNEWRKLPEDQDPPAVDHYLSALLLAAKSQFIKALMDVREGDEAPRRACWSVARELLKRFADAGAPRFPKLAAEAEELIGKFP